MNILDKEVRFDNLIKLIHSRGSDFQEEVYSEDELVDFVEGLLPSELNMVMTIASIYHLLLTKNLIKEKK